MIIGVSAVVLVVGFLIYKRKRRSNTHDDPEDEQPLSPQELVCD